MKKIMIIGSVFLAIVLLCTLGFIPVKHAVYVDKFDEEVEYENSVYQWFVNGIKGNNIDIAETSMILGKPFLKLSGGSYIGEYDEHNDIPVYFQVNWNSPLWWLNSNFSPKEVENYYAIKYTELGFWETKDGYHEMPIFISDWAPIYPIQRSGWLASRILPKDYLVIWDFIGWRACW